MQTINTISIHETRRAVLWPVAWMAWALCSCDMIESSPYDVNVGGAKHLTNKNISLIEEATRGRDEICFAMISDSQRSYDETLAAVKAINRRDDLDFVLHGGDLTEYGATREFLWQREILDRLRVPYVCVIGNHDCVATGVETYQTVFGPLNFSFSAGNVRFVCLNTNALEFDHTAAVPDFGYIMSELDSFPEETVKSVVLMHAGPFSEQFDNNVAPGFHALISRMPGLQFCLYGHGHHVTADDMFGDGVIYYQCAATKKRSYLVFTIKADGTYDYAVEKF